MARLVSSGRYDDKKNMYYFLIAYSLCLTVSLQGQDLEYQEAKDHAVLGRFAGSVLLDAGETNYAEVEMPSLYGESVFQVNGEMGWRLYGAPEGKTSIEVMRNYEVALKKAGFTIRLACHGQSCRYQKYRALMSWVQLAGKTAPAKRLRVSYIMSRPFAPEDFLVKAPVERLGAVVAERKRPGGSTYVFVAIGENPAPKTAALPDGTKLSSNLESRAWTFAEVVEDAKVETGKVEVFDAASIGAGLVEQGKKALYGIYFASNEAVMQPESKDQIAQIAALLNQDPKLSIYVVGHTDSVGGLEANLDLSRRRAQAVIGGLTGEYRIAVARLSPQGLGPLAPVASNKDETGRALNRRVELVLR